MSEQKHTPVGAVYTKDCEVVAVYEQSTIDALQARIKELEAQRDELLSGIDKALTMYATGQPMQFVADKLAEVYDKIEASVGATAEKAE